VLARRPIWTEAVAVVGAAAALACAVTWPLILHVNDHIFGLGGDSTGTIAGLRIMADEMGYDIIGTSHMLVSGAPFGWEQGNGINIQSALVFFPAYVVSEVAGAVLAYNLVVLSGLVLSGLAMYVLVRRLRVHPLVAAWAGLAYTVFPWHLEKAQGHASFVHLEGFPLLLLAALGWHLRPNLWRGLALAGASLVLWTTSGYFGVIGFVALGALLPLSFLAHRRRLGSPAALKWLALGSAGTVFAAGLIYAIASLGAVSGTIGTPKGVSELSAYGARLWEYVVPSYRNPIFGDEVGPWLLERLHGSNFSETSLYVGWVTLLLAAGWTSWLLLRPRRIPPEQAFAGIALPLLVVVGVIFSLASPLGETGVPAPARAIWEIAPQFRVTSRFVVLVVTALIPLGALALDALARRAVRASRDPTAGRLALAGVALTAATLSFAESTIVPPVTLTNLGDTPLHYRGVPSAPRGIVAEYPLVAAEHAINADYLYWQGAHDRRLLNGAPAGTFADAVRQTVIDPAAPGTPSALAALGVSVVIVDAPRLAVTPQTNPPAEQGVGYRLLGRYPDGVTTWHVVAPPAPALAIFTDNFGFSEPQAGRPTARWLGDDSGTVELVGVRPGRYLVRFFATSYARPRKLWIQGQGGERRFSVPPEGATLELPLNVPSGRSLLSLRTSPGPEEIPDGRRVTVYIHNWEFEPMPRGASGLLEPVPGGTS
jgi:hypothetical protein